MRDWTVAALVFVLLACLGWPASARTVTDLGGRRVDIPDDCRRVVAIGPGSLRLIVYAGAADRVVGIEALERRGAASRPYAEANVATFGGLPVIGEGGPGKSPDIEALLAVGPDIVFSNALDNAQVDLIQARIGAPVVMVSYGADGIYDDGAIAQSLRLIGRSLDRIQRVEALLAYLAAAKTDLARRGAAMTAPGPSVYVGGVAYKAMQGITSTQAHFLPLMLIGANNLADQLAAKSQQLFVDREQILGWNPTAIFIDAGGLPAVIDDVARNGVFYAHLAAFSDGRAFTTMPYNAYATNIEIAFANAYFFGKTLDQTAFADVDVIAKAGELVTMFVGRNVYPALQQVFPGFHKVRLVDGRLVIE